MSTLNYALVYVTLLLLSVSSQPRTAGSVKIQEHNPLKGRVLTLEEFGKAGLGGDDTSVFRRALAEASRTGRALEIAASRLPYLVGPLYLRANTTVLLDSGVTIQALPGYLDGQKLFTIGDVSSVQILGYGATLKMNRGEYKSGEYRHCLSITGSSLVVVKGVTCVSPGGYGLYIAGSEKKAFSQDITLEDVTVENAVRTGLQINSVRNLVVRRSHFNHNHGNEKPKTMVAAVDKPAGIELNPTSSDARLENVRLEDTATSNNAGDGVRVMLSRSSGSSMPVSIAVSHHHDYASGGSSFSGSNEPSAGLPVRGNLIFEDCRSELAQEYGAVLSFWDSPGVHASFRGLTVVDPDVSGTTMYNVAIAIKRGGGGRNAIGDVEFVRTTIQDSRRTPKLDYYFSVIDYSRIGIRNVVFRDPVQLTGARHREPIGLYQGEGVEHITPADSAAIRAIWQTAEKRASADRPNAR